MRPDDRTIDLADWRALKQAQFERIAATQPGLVNAGGTLIPQFQFSAAPGSCTVLAGTMLCLNKMAGTTVGPWA